MLVSEIGYLNSVSKSMYGINSAKVQNNKSQNNKFNLNEGFGNVDLPKVQENSMFSIWFNSMQSLFSTNNSNAKNNSNVLSLMA